MSSLHHFINALSNSKAPSSSWGQTGPNSLPSSQLARKCLWVQTANLGREKFRPRDHRPKAHHSPGNLCRGTWNCPKMCPKSLVDWENHNFQSSYSHCNMNLQFLCPVSTSCWSPRLSQWFSQPFHFMAAAPRAPMPPLLSGCSLKLFGVKGIPSSVYTLKVESWIAYQWNSRGVLQDLPWRQLAAIPVFQRSLPISPGEIPNFHV